MKKKVERKTRASEWPVYEKVDLARNAKGEVSSFRTVIQKGVRLRESDAELLNEQIKNSGFFYRKVGADYSFQNGNIVEVVKKKQKAEKDADTGSEEQA
jgi:hypothetical protein